MNITKTRVIIAGGLLLGIGGFAWGMFGSAPTQTFVTDVVKRGDLQHTVEVTGELKSVTDLSLAFETSGTVSAVFVEAGDSVRAGDVLAELGTSELGAAAEQARQGVVAAQAELDLRLTGISSEEEAAERAGVAVAAAQLSAASTDLDTALLTEAMGNAQDAATVASAQSDFDQVATQNAEATEQASEGLHAALNTALIIIRTGLESADQVLGVENTLLNIDIDEYVGILDRNTLTDATEAFVLAADARDEAEDLVLALTEDALEADVLLAYANVSSAMTYTSNTLLYVSRALDASMSDSGDFSNADLIALRATIAAERTTVSTGMTALRTAKYTYDTALRQADDRLTDATNALALAEAQQHSGEATRSAAVLKAEAAIAIQTANMARAEALLAQVLADPREIDVAALRAAVARADAEYTAALARLRKAQVRAPIDGVVTRVAFDIGEQVSAGQEMIGEIAGNDTYEIILDVPEADIASLATGQVADVTFDAFGDRVMFSGSVYAVDPAEKVISDVVFYEVSVVLNTDQDVSMLKPGMSANVTVHTQERTDVLFVPSRAILERDTVPYVRVPKNEHEFEEVLVTVGLRADDGLSEIVSGVEEGTAVVISVKTE